MFAAAFGFGQIGDVASKVACGNGFAGKEPVELGEGVFVLQIGVFEVAQFVLQDGVEVGFGAAVDDDDFFKIGEDGYACLRVPAVFGGLEVAVAVLAQG